MTSKNKETPLAKEAVRSRCHLKLRNTCDTIQQALNSESVDKKTGQEKTAWDSKQHKNRMQNQEIIIYVHGKSQKHRKIEGMMFQQSPISSLVSKSFTQKVFKVICVACSQRCPLFPSYHISMPCLWKWQNKAFSTWLKWSHLPSPTKPPIHPRGKIVIIFDNPMLSAIYFLADDFLKIETIKINY